MCGEVRAMGQEARKLEVCGLFGYGDAKRKFEQLAWKSKDRLDLCVTALSLRLAAANTRSALQLPSPHGREIAESVARDAECLREAWSAYRSGAQEAIGATRARFRSGDADREARRELQALLDGQCDQAGGALEQLQHGSTTTLRAIEAARSSSPISIAVTLDSRGDVLDVLSLTEPANDVGRARAAG
jgi:hypothetical protein